MQATGVKTGPQPVGTLRLSSCQLTLVRTALIYTSARTVPGAPPRIRTGPISPSEQVSSVPQLGGWAWPVGWGRDLIHGVGIDSRPQIMLLQLYPIWA